MFTQTRGFHAFMKRWVMAMLLFAASTLVAHAQDDDDGLSNAQIVGVLLVANQAEIAAGQLAAGRTKSRSVQVYANRMVIEHQQVNQDANAVLQRAGATAQRSNTSDAITREARDALSSLEDASEYDFDQRYLAREVDFLGRLVNVMDGYIRTTSNTDLKSLLLRSRPSFILQLDQAQRLRIALARPGYSR